MDLPAKCKVLNMPQFNRFFGCSTYEEPVQHEKKGRGTVLVYPYQNKVERYPQGDSLKDCDTGIIGYSGLIGMEWFDLVLDIVPDYMHGALLSTIKVLMHLWFPPTNSTEPFFLGNQLKQFLKRMNNLKPPHCVDRLPEDLELNYNSFKATEYQIFLLYYGIPCLFEILPHIYLSHFAYFSEAIHILLSDAIITAIDLEKAESL